VPAVVVTGPGAVAPHAGEHPERQGMPVRVLHFVTGGFSGGATQVAIGLTRAALADGGRVQALLVLRRKWGADPARIARLREEGIPLMTVPRWPRMLTILRLATICRSFRADVLVAHGYSEHLWGRYAGLLAGVRRLVQVEHNTRERYTRWRLAQTRWLARRTARIVACSEGVRAALLRMDLPAERVDVIPNGIHLGPFAAVEMRSFFERTAGIVMVARFSRQKDHATLLRAVALLRQRGVRPPVMLAGGGKPVHRRAVQALARELGLIGQVRFLGICPNVPALLMQHQITVLSTHHEGMPLAVLEGMAAGCAVIASDVDGVRGIFDDGEQGCLVPAADPVALANAMESLLRQPAKAAMLGSAARAAVIERYAIARMNQSYRSLFVALADDRQEQREWPPVTNLDNR
jgi:glycosyltransferase involved in cell wall biosynthesis